MLSSMLDSFSGGRVVRIVCAAAIVAGCDNTASVSFRTGPIPFDVSTSSFGLPAELREDTAAGPQIRAVPCGPTGMCPSSTSPDGITVTCEAGTCNPAARTITVPAGDVIDIDELSADLRDLFTEIDRIEVTAADYAVTLNTLSIDLPAAEIWWAPEGAIEADPAMGAHLLGTVPPAPARTTPAGQVAIDAAGSDALSEYLVGVSRRVRFFVRSRVDLEPGQAFPEGSMMATVDVALRASGKIVE